MPTVSVILPVYNATAFIEETLQSLQQQTLADFELICVDDGSTDGTLDLLNEYAQADQRIRVIHQQNEGPGSARNNGLDHAGGDYVCMLDADDIYDPSLLKTLHERAVQTDADIVVCKSTMFDDSTGEELESRWTVKDNQLPQKDTFSPEEIEDFVFTAFMGWPWDKMYRRSFIEENGLRYPALKNSEDLYFVFLANVKARAISVIDKKLVRHRMNRTGSVSTSRAKAPLDFYKSSCLLKKALESDPSLYSKFSWSFFNWAFEYMIWNINTMTDESARRVQLDALANGKFSELELDRHASAFFALNPALYTEYTDLLCEAYGLPVQEKQPMTFLQRLGWFILRVDEKGFKKAMATFIGNRTAKHSEEEKIVRSSDYMITDKQTLIQHLEKVNGAK